MREGEREGGESGRGRGGKEREGESEIKSERGRDGECGYQ